MAKRGNKNNKGKNKNKNKKTNRPQSTTSCFAPMPPTAATTTTTGASGTNEALGSGHTPTGKEGLVSSTSQTHQGRNQEGNGKFCLFAC